MKSLILDARQDAGFEARFQAALDVARASKGHLTCVFASPFSTAMAMGDALGAAEILRLAAEQEDKARVAIEARMAHEDVSWDYIASQDDPARALVRRAALSDLVVMSHPPQGKGGRMEEGLISDVIMGARTPVAVLPAAAHHFDITGSAAIAWNGSIEAAFALKSALPLLRHAASVHVIGVDDVPESRLSLNEAAEYLSRHGIVPEVMQRPAGHAGIIPAILDAVGECQARYLVMGAFGHNRIREYWFGGVTRDMIERLPMPLVFMH
ncbi:universal stress protein [Aquisediminimonas sediminicola]|uniref:universal stress protein n=1 Tax=Alteraquisediminimonas sediminicola TaxID=2676787 RepID=UPI001C8DF844|nr:universal stress protein [Aquisediminimonas sediminicola]